MGILRAPNQAILTHLAEHEDDEHAEQRGYVKGTDYALPYFSQWSRLHSSEARDDVLRHVNCGYLSTHGVPPTLLTLKQHAQSLCVLIHALNPTLESAEIAGGNPSRAGQRKDHVADDPLALKYELNDAFDFLNDLTIPYTNDDPNHNKPLLALANEVRGRHEAHGTTSYHCPFAETKPRAKGEKQKPYANHHALVMHANACLERLDHEFSSTGGLMSLLPVGPSPGDPSPDLAHARNSLLGQWLHFTQSLVARMHDLERAYANALDALAGEAAVPHQHLSALGPDARAAGREIAYPQDRWVLANAGDDVLDYVHQLLDRREAVAQAKERVWAGNGVVGEQMVSSSSGGDEDGKAGAGRGGLLGKEYVRGIVHVDVKTRYYRLAGRGRDTVFVLPAWEHHPGVGYTKEVERQPTVVACVQPKFPVRATELEKRYTGKLNWAQKTELENLRMRDEVGEMKAELRVLRRQNEMLAQTRDALMLAAGDGGELAGRVQEQRERAGKAEKEVKKAMKERDEAVGREEDMREELENLRIEVVTLRKKADASK